MNITRNNVDDLNAVLTVSISKDDYSEKVENALNKYRKTATIKGFRKGQVPMSFVKKQFEKGIVFDEVNQLLQTGINEYIQKEQLSILGNPLPRTKDDFDWDADELNFEFELGLAPEFDVDFSKVKTTAYKVLVSEEEVQKYVDNFAKRFGSLINLEKVENGANVKVRMKQVDSDKIAVEGGLDKETYLFIDELKNPKKFVGKKLGDEIFINSQDLFDDEAKLENLLDKSSEEIKDLSIELKFEILEINKMEPSPIDQSLFDKVYGEGAVKNEEEFRNKIKDEAEKMYLRETNQQLMNDTVEELIKQTKFELPQEFLSKWLHTTNDKVETIDQANDELKKMEDSLRYQLIEAKIADKYALKIEPEEIENATRSAIETQFAMYGQTNIPEEDMNRIVQSSLQNQTEYKRMADQVFSDKMLQVFKENAQMEEKEVSFDEFVQIMEEKHAHHHDHSHDSQDELS